MACARSRRPSLARMRPTWVLTVCSATTSRSAISALDSPPAMSASTSVSRSVSLSSLARVGAKRFVHVLVEVERGQYQDPRSGGRLRAVDAPDDVACGLQTVHPRHPD